MIKENPQLDNEKPTGRLLVRGGMTISPPNSTNLPGIKMINIEHEYTEDVFRGLVVANLTGLHRVTIEAYSGEARMYVFDDSALGEFLDRAKPVLAGIGWVVE